MKQPHVKLGRFYTITRLHSSRMRTARLLTVSQHALRRGVSARGGMADPPCGQSDRQV